MTVQTETRTPTVRRVDNNTAPSIKEDLAPDGQFIDGEFRPSSSGRAHRCGRPLHREDDRPGRRGHRGGRRPGGRRGRCGRSAAGDG